MTEQAADDPIFMAAVDMIRRTGAHAFQIRFSDDEQPVVWIAVAEHRIIDGMPVPQGGIAHFDAGAGMNPRQAVLRLLDQLIDGGMCQHCHRPTGVTEDYEGEMPLSDAFCWYRFDPELATFRRGCE